jgi:DNA integration/recombination protein
VWSTAFNVDKIIDTFQKQLKQKQSLEFIKTLFELAVKNITVYPDKIKVALLVTQERFELPTP